MALFYQFENGRIREHVFLTLLKQLRNFLIIYNIRGITANRIDNDVHDLAYSIFEAKCERDIINRVYLFFLKDRSFFSFDDIPSAVKGLRYSNHKRYTMATSGMFVYLFEMMYKEKYADYEYIHDYKNWTMEHIVNDCCDEDYVSYFGNLLLLTRKLNGKCKSKEYAEKRKIYMESGFSWVKDYASEQHYEPTKNEIEIRTMEIAATLAKITAFDVSYMKEYCAKTEKVTLFLNKLEQDGGDYHSYIGDFKEDEYEQIEAKLRNKYKNQELLDLLG